MQENVQRTSSLVVRSMRVFLQKIQNKDNTYNSEMNRFKELFARMLKCILLLSQQSGSAISRAFFRKS